MTPCVNTLAEGERHLLSNHANIEATNYNAIKHFLFVESFRAEQKLAEDLLESRSPRPGNFCDSSNGFRPGDIDFLTLPTNNERNQLACQFPGSSSVHLA